MNAEAHVVIATDLCKGCTLCVAWCPKRCLAMGAELNRQGYRSVLYAGDGCNGCGICFYTCPEPGAIEVYRPRKAP